MDTSASTVIPDGLPRRISPPATLGKKRHGSGRGENQGTHLNGNQHQQRRGHVHQQGQAHKRQKFHHKNHSTNSNGNNGEHFSNGSNSGNNNNNSSSSDPTKTSVNNIEPMDLDPIFPKLDQSNPDHAKRIQTRRKTVAMGKNTAGYFEYTKKVPKHKRKPRSMETPFTPDHTLDIPARRWLGMVKAWRKALHQYDPADLLQNTTGADNQKPKSHANNTSSNTNKGKGGGDIQSREIENAIAKGLLVDVSTPPRSTPTTSSSQSNNEFDSLVGTPFSVLSEDKPASSEGCHDAIVDLEGTAFADGCSDSFADDDDDSDDDLL